MKFVTISTFKFIKIKETFPSIGVKKIDQINNIVKGISKTEAIHLNDYERSIEKTCYYPHK